MDEQQTTQQPITNSDAGQDYSVQNSVPLPEDAPEPEISITTDGQVQFGKDFFGDIQNEPVNNNSDATQTATTTNTTTHTQTTPNYYTDEALQNTPYEQWAMARMPEEVRRYATALNKQREIQIRQQQIQQTSQNLPDFLVQPKQYTPKELNEEARALAIKKLGLENADEFDDYEGEHRAAVDVARQELLLKRADEIANYQRQRGEFEQLQQFNANFVAQPDYNDFQKWYFNEVQSKNITHEQVLTELTNLAQNQGCRAVQAFWGDVYKRFQSEKLRNAQNVQAPAQRTRAKMPPTLESSRGGSYYDGRKNINFRDFGELDDDAQAQALIDMGIV